MKHKKVLIINEHSNSPVFSWLYDFFKYRSWEIVCGDNLSTIDSSSEDKPDMVFFLAQESAFKKYLLPDLITENKYSSTVILLFNDSGNLAKMLMNNELSAYLSREKELEETADIFPHENDIANAVENKEFVLFYQPIINLNSGKISGFEALIRWRHPEKGLILPDKFIPLAEATGLILPMGSWLIEEAVSRIKSWHEKYNPQLSVSINLSPVQFINLNLAEEIRNVLDANKIDPKSLAVRFEITENAFIKDMEASNLMLLKLKAMDILLYMDDFGTGYSSLTYLKHFPVDALKIDKSFVKWMGVDDESSEIVSAVINLAHNLKMFVVAEGVETKEHLQTLKNLGCEYGQGYYFSKPLPVEEIEKLLETDPAW